MQPTTRQKMAKTIPTTKPTRKPKNNTKHQRGDKNGLKLTGPLGTHSNLMFKWLGLESRRIIPLIRENVFLIRRALSGAVCHFKGQVFKWDSNCYLRFKPIRSEIPIYISGFGKDLLELSGEIGDGSLPMLTPPESVEYALEHIHVGIKKSKRKVEDFDIVGLIWLSVSTDGRVAEDSLKSIIAFFGPYLDADALKSVGLGLEDFEPIRQDLPKEMLMEQRGL